MKLELKIREVENGFTVYDESQSSKEGQYFVGKIFVASDVEALLKLVEQLAKPSRDQEK